MKVLLTAINAKYIHSNLAVYSLKAYAKKYKDNIELAEYTINNYSDEIIQSIYKKQPDIIAFSCYIWNISLVEEVAAEIHKILPNAHIWFGGPEVSYDARECLEQLNYLDGIMIGEGEETFLELLEYYNDLKNQTGKSIETLRNIKGIAFRGSDNEIIITNIREQLDLSTIPFPYENLEDFENKIMYYESSRGCPYSCSYCLSSIDKSVRLRNTELVKTELQMFLDHKIPQVKFVDRTFNCNRIHSLEIFRYIKEHDNGITNFHFEISADLIRDEELELLKTFRPGLAQLEIGVQSTNEDTIKAINRKMDLNKLSYAVSQINKGNNIHQHLDLIAGLPYEDYMSFRNSFADVYKMRPDQFQLGFLKVLKGSYMYEQSKKGNIIYKSIPPYEVLYTKWLPYSDVLKLKKVEDMVEVYYNSGQFTNSIIYMEHFYENPFDLYKGLGDYYERMNYNEKKHSRISRYDILLEYAEKELKRDSTNYDKNVFIQIMIYDLYLRENIKSRPIYAPDHSKYKEVYRNFYLEESNIEKYLSSYKEYDYKQIGRLTHMEHFTIDVVETASGGETIKEDNFILFDYANRNPLNYEARTVTIHISNSIM